MGRKKIVMNDIELIVFEAKRVEFSAQIRAKKAYDNNKRRYIYDNQQQFGREICDKFKNPETLFVMAIAQMQSGKTGTMVSLIEQYINQFKIPLDNIYVITGHSSISWKDQTVEEFPQLLKDRIYHRDELDSKFRLHVHGKRNVLIIMDEVQIAARNKQTVHNVFEKLGFMNREYMYENDIKIVEFSATPDGVLNSRKQWSDAFSIVIGKPGDKYYGVFNYLDDGRILDSKDLSGWKKNGKHDKDLALNNIADLGLFIEEKFSEPKYHIIRLPSALEAQRFLKSNMRHVCGDRYNYKDYDMTTGQVSINEILKIKPHKHTFVFVKEMLRCSDKIEKHYLGIGYERCVIKNNDSVQCQGIAGRFCGYDTNPFSFIFVSRNSLELYRAHFESGFSLDLPWNSNTTNRQTYADEDTCSETSESNESNYGYRLFTDAERFTKLVEFTRMLGNWKPRKNIGMHIKELQGHTSEDLVQRHWGLSLKNPKRMARGTDNIWVVWWLKNKFPGI